MTDNTQNENPIAEAAAAELLGLEPATLRRWRCCPPRGLVPPPYRKYGSHRASPVRYLPSELLAWREAMRRGPGDLISGKVMA